MRKEIAADTVDASEMTRVPTSVPNTAPDPSTTGVAGNSKTVTHTNRAANTTGPQMPRAWTS